MALILVRNAVTHDARVQREAETLRRLGFSPLIAGVVSGEAQERELECHGVPTLRLDPAAALRRASRVIPRSQTRAPAPADAPQPGPPSVNRGAAGQSRLRRLAVTAAYYWQGVRLVLSRSPALVHANDYNTMWIGIAARVLRGSRLIYDAHELWPDRNGRPEWRPWLLACEGLFVRAAHVTITTSPGYADVLSRRYRVARPVVIRNIPQRRGVSARPATVDPQLGVYVGGLMPGRGLEQAIHALALTRDVRLRLIGPGREAYRLALIDLALRAGVSERVQVRPAVAPEELVRTIASGGFGLMLIQPVCLSYELTLPNKLFEYAAAGLPMVASDLPVIARLVREHRLGRVVAPSDPPQIARAMEELARPGAGSQLRAQVAQFAAANTWEDERTVLESVYRGTRLPERARVSQAYDSYAGRAGKRRSWSAANQGNRAIRAELVRRAFELAGPSLRSARRILDAGCGTGWWLECLASGQGVSAELYGLELLPGRAASAARRVPAASISTGDVRALPFPDGHFDVVSLFTVLSSLAGPPDIRQALGESRRVLRPGGALLLWEPRVVNPLNRQTAPVSRQLLDDALAGMTMVSRTTTVLPALARRLGRTTDVLYPGLVRLRVLRTHRLVCAVEAAPGAAPDGAA